MVQELFPARVAGVNLAQFRQGVGFVDYVQKHHTRLTVAPSSVNNLVHELPGSDIQFFDFGNQPMLVAENPPWLHIFAVELAKPRLIRMVDDRFHEFVSDAYGNVKVSDVTFDFFAMDEIQNVRMVN